MPSGNYGMSTGSDTRMYAPRSESNNMYGANSEDDDSYRHGIGDPESMERRRDKLEADKENAKKVKDLPHLRLETVEPKPDLPPGMEDMEESLEMSNQFEEGQQFAAMTGMPGQGGPDVSQSVGAQVNQPFGQQTIANIATGEPMADAWSSLLKEDSVCPNCQGTGKDPNQKGIPEEGIEPGECEPCDGSGMHWVQAPLDERGFPIESYEENDPNWQKNIETGEPMESAWSSLMKEHKPWHQPQMETTPYGRSKADKITDIRSKVVASKLGHPADKGGLNESPLSLHRGHRQTTQPISAFPEKYQQSLGRQASRRLMGGIEMPKGMQQRPLHSERPKPVGKPTPPRIPKEPSEPSMKLASTDFLAKKKDIDLTLPRGKEMVLKAEDKDYDRGLLVTLLKNGGYDMAYWYDKHEPYPIEVLVDGKSIKKDAKKVTMKFHPELKKKGSKDTEEVRKTLEGVRKKMDYMRFNQLRRLLRRLKNKVDDRRLKMADPGGIGEAGPGDGNMSTNPQGATESIQADEAQHGSRSDGAGGSGKMFGRKGSGRVA